jgi:hypothetical protein
MKGTNALVDILERARGYCEKRNFRGRSGKPVMIPEDLLLAMAQQTESRICDDLAKSGLATDRLRNAVTGSMNLP